MSAPIALLPPRTGLSVVGLDDTPTPANDAAGDSEAYASVTIWTDGGYYLQVHYGHFDSWEHAEDFATVGRLRLERRSNALFLIGPHGDAWIPDQATSIYRGLVGEANASYSMTLDDLFEVSDPVAMDLIAIGSRPVKRSQPVVAAAMEAWEFVSANDDGDAD